MKHKIVVVFAFLALSVTKCVCQPFRIDFNNETSWAELKNNAIRSNKLIFISLTHPACTSCKWMDALIYSDSSIADFYNKNFISIRIDTTKLRAGYKDFEPVIKLFDGPNGERVSPSYLFLSMDGQALHKGIGKLTIPEFLRLGRNSLDENKQYYTLLKKYRDRPVDFEVIRSLIEISENLKYNDLASTLSDIYEEHLFTNNDSTIYDRWNLTFLGSKVSKTDDRIFHFFLKHASDIDKKMGKGFSFGITDRIIYKQYFYPLIQPAVKSKIEPNWNLAIKQILKASNKAAVKRTLLDAKVKWYGSTKDWNMWAYYNEKKIRKYGPSWLGYNGEAWTFFLYVTNRQYLQKAVHWMNNLLKGKESTNTAYLDTKSNLLYKLGQVQKAISIQQSAMFLDSITARDRNGSVNPVFRENIEKMNRGIPTWITDTQTPSK